MPPRRRSSAAAAAPKPDLMLGIVGTGVIDDAEIEAILNELLGQEQVNTAEAVFALTNDAYGDGAYGAWEYLKTLTADGVTLVAVTAPDGSDDDKALVADAEAAKARQLPVADSPAVTVADELVKAKSDGVDARLVVFWDTEDADEDVSGQYAAVETAIAGGVQAFNACDAMDEITLDDSGEDAAPAAEPEPEQPKRRGRGRATAKEEEPAAAAAPAAEEPPTRTRRSRKAAEPVSEAAADEAQAEALPSNGHVVDLSDEGVGEILNALANMFARAVVAELKQQDTNEEAAAAPRRDRRA